MPTTTRPPTAALMRALQDPALYPHPVERFRLVETHISFVLLTGPCAYKVKKPVDLGFLDFRTLASRKHFCEEELRLNRRLAAGLYEAVVAVTGSPEAPMLDGPGEPIEYAVRMRQFPAEAELDRALEAGRLEARHFETLAEDVAAFHAAAEAAPPDSAYGTRPAVAGPVRDNFRHLARSDEIERLRSWCEAELEARGPLMDARRRAGRVRECHGDMHLANMVLLDDRVVPFDCLEFNPGLRWIDVLSEVAFLLMDLDYRRRPDLARRFLSVYLEHGGDYGGLGLLRLYRVYRALVRAKVAAIQLAQAGAPCADLELQYRRHLALALEYVEPPAAPCLVLTHGPSGAGKSRLARALVDHLDAVQVRADVERKRLYGLRPLEPSGSAVGADLYAREATERTYGRLRELAREIVAAGLSAVLDATFLDRAERGRCRALAAELGVPCVILDLQAPGETLAARVRGRGADPSEATPAVLARQLRTREPLDAREQALAVAVDATAPFDAEAVARAVRAVAFRCRASGRRPV